LAAADSGGELDFRECLALVARMVGGRQGAIFLHRPKTDRLHLVASLLHPDRADEGLAYEWGQGVTGWVARRNRPVRIGRLNDPAELQALDPNDPPVWRSHVNDGRDGDEVNLTYLGVPLAVGSHVLGVLRLASTEAGSFTTYDLQTAVAAASRLAGWLYQNQQ